MIQSKQAEVAGPYRRRPAPARSTVLGRPAADPLLSSTKSAPRPQRPLRFCGQKGPAAVASMMDRARAEPCQAEAGAGAGAAAAICLGLGVWVGRQDGNRGSRHDGAHGAPGQFPGVPRFPARLLADLHGYPTPLQTARNNGVMGAAAQRSAVAHGPGRGRLPSLSPSVRAAGGSHGPPTRPRRCRCRDPRGRAASEPATRPRHVRCGRHRVSR